MPDSNSTQASVAIIGAGIAGLTCARQLQAQGLNVQVLEKSRSVGGRMSTRTGTSWQCDHGAQYFTAQSAQFRQELARWEEAGVAQQWTPRLRVIDEVNGPWRDSSNHTKRYVGVPSMAAPAQFLAQSLAVHLEAHVEGLRREPGGWRLHILGEGWQDYLYDAVVLALPAPQAQGLLSESTSVLRDLVGSVRMRAAWALMMCCDESFDPQFDAAFVNSGPIRWVARNLSKPQRQGDNMWLLHATAKWSEDNLDAKPSEVAVILIAEFQKIFPFIASSSSMHRWRYADAESTLGQEHLWDPEQGLGLCGDWLNESKVEGAWRSAASLAKMMAHDLKIKQLGIKLISIQFTSIQYEQALALRNAVLRNPLGRSLDNADLDGENEQLHYGIIGPEKELIACLSVKLLGEERYKIRQMAVDHGWHRQGLGSRLMTHVENELSRRGAQEICLHARVYAVEFYEKLGFNRCGESFYEVGIEHVKMSKTMRESPSLGGASSLSL